MKEVKSVDGEEFKDFRTGRVIIRRFDTEFPDGETVEERAMTLKERQQELPFKEEILNAATDEGCDVIVLGTHGKGFLAHAFLGSVSKAVLHRPRKPVFIIPLPSEKTSVDWDGVC